MANGLGERMASVETGVSVGFAQRDRAVELLRQEAIERLTIGDVALRDHIEREARSLEAALTAANLAQHKFEVSVSNRFTQVNEFRGALDDLGKLMATRRELEAGLDSSRAERAALIGELRQRAERNAEEIAKLRSRLDQGPPELREAVNSSREGRGGELVRSELWTRALSAGSFLAAMIVAVFYLIHG